MKRTISLTVVLFLTIGLVVAAPSSASAHRAYSAPTSQFTSVKCIHLGTKFAGNIRRYMNVLLQGIEGDGIDMMKVSSVVKAQYALTKKVRDAKSRALMDSVIEMMDGDPYTSVRIMGSQAFSKWQTRMVLGGIC